MRKITRHIILIVSGAMLFTFKVWAQKKDSTTISAPKIPWDGFDMSWMNGNDRRDSSAFNLPHFDPCIMVDNNLTYSFSNPIDHTVVGSTAVSRDNEMTISSLNFGGDLTYGNAHARIMTQIGTRSEVVPRNDFSTLRGENDLADAYRYIDEGYAGYHFNVWYGINIDAGLFMSYIGLNSYFQQENWEYQSSYTSDNTPWFFNGIRVQIFPTKYLKIEPWIINGWQSFGMFNALPGLGCNITWVPKESLKLLTNDYWGTDDAGFVGRHRFHSDNSFLLRYYHAPKSKKGITQMAFSLTADIGFEQGDGVDGFQSSTIYGPAQYFESWMFYDRIWFAHGKLAWYAGGGQMTNPGRYLVLEPTGQSSGVPTPAAVQLLNGSILQTNLQQGLYAFTENPGDLFSAWDCSMGISWMPNQSMEFKVEYVYRHSSVPYFAGHGGVTSPNGYTTDPVLIQQANGSYTPIPGWSPDLVNFDERIIIAFLFRL